MKNIMSRIEQAEKELKIIEEKSAEYIELQYLKKQVEDWKHKYQSQCSKMGAYKAKVTKEIREREQDIEWREKKIEEKLEFIKNNNYDDLYKERQEIADLRRKVEKNDEENREQIKKDFEEMKQEIIDELSKELIRWTEENDIDNQRSQGYLIGINKAKKIIKEKMQLKLKNKSIRIERILN